MRDYELAWEVGLGSVMLWARRGFLFGYSGRVGIAILIVWLSGSGWMIGTGIITRRELVTVEDPSYIFASASPKLRRIVLRDCL